MQVVLLRARCEVGSFALRAPAELRTVDALARLQLAARRLGCTVVLRDADPDLRALLELVGLAEVLVEGASEGRSGGGVEVVG